VNKQLKTGLPKNPVLTSLFIAEMARSAGEAEISNQITALAGI